MILIPFDSTQYADQDFRIRLGDTMATLTLRYNTRSAHWWMDVANEAQEILRSLKVVPNYPLMKEFDGSQPIDGEFFILALDDSATEPIAYPELGLTWGIYWASPSEAKEWGDFYGVG